LGTGFVAGEAVAVKISHAGAPSADDPTWTTFANELGAFTLDTGWAIPLSDVAGNSFAVTATGALESAVATFRRIAVVETDKYKYQPGETAVIAGAGFLPGESVSVHVEHSNGRNDGAGHLPFPVAAETDGTIHSTWEVAPDDSEGAIFRLTATGATSGLTATTTLTDPPVTVFDDAGPDDQPGQKDLNYLQVDYGPTFDPTWPFPLTDIAVVWGWDDIAWSGNNTGDACTLFDTNRNGFANYSLCITVDQAGAYLATRLYVCTADSRADRCGGPELDPSFVSIGTASIATADPFGVSGTWNDVPYTRTNNDCSTGATGCLVHVREPLP
jgi:hypothetical protein